MADSLFIAWFASPTLALGFPQGIGEWLIIAAFGLLLFGKRLPEVGRSLGKGIVEFKKGLKGVEDDIVKEEPEPKKIASTHKFDPETGQPLNQAGEAPKAG